MDSVTQHFCFPYYFGCSIIQTATNIKDLGVYFSANLSFEYHVNCVVAKANKMLGFVRRTTKDITDVTVLLSLYRTLVLSKLEYASSVWSPSQAFLSLKIERVQKRVVKWLLKRVLNIKMFLTINCVNVLI